MDTTLVEFRMAADDDEPGDPGDTTPQPVVRRGYACEHDPTVFLSDDDGFFCSGVMIGERTVLTAAHCFYDQQRRLGHDGLRAATGAGRCDDRGPMATGVTIHPGYRPEREDAGFGISDLAIVRLDAPIAGTGIATLGQAIPATDSAAVTFSGFGDGAQLCGDGAVVSASTSGVLRIEGETAPGATLPTTTCFGDSGGPVYLRGTQVLVGVVSGGETQGNRCVGDVIVNADWSWVEQELASGQSSDAMFCSPGDETACHTTGDRCESDVFACGLRTCGDDGRWGACVHQGPNGSIEICNGADDDCDGEIDEDCFPIEGEGGVVTCPDGRTVDPATSTCSCANLCPPGAVMGPGCICSDPCGDGVCSAYETAWSCPFDCHASCGDGFCDITESHATCADDCEPDVCICFVDCPPDAPGCEGACGDGVCNLPVEDSTSCPQDCSLGGGGGGGGGAIDPVDLCSDGEFWGWCVDTVGFDDALALYELWCAASE
ncbi:MAG: S1 family peptidase [Nannocystaceae bacterium]